MYSEAYQRSPDKIRQDTSGCVEDHKALVKFHFQQGNIEKALKHITAHLRINHDDLESVVNACRMLTRLGRRDIADRLYMNFKKRYPEKTRIYLEQRTDEAVMAENWPSDSLPRYNGEGIEKDKHFFFVIAAPRSGTTWFSKFLTTDETFCFHELTSTSHKNVVGLIDALSKFPVIPGGGLTAAIFRLLYLYPSMGRRMYHKLYEQWQYIACGNSDNQQISIGLALAHIFPNSRFLIVLRNGFDLALSVERRMLDSPYGAKVEKWLRESAAKRGIECKTLFDVASYRWLDDTLGLMEIAETLDEDRVKVVSFEKAICDVGLLGEIWEFLFAGKVPFDEQRAHFFIKQRINGGRHQRLSGDTIKERWQDLDKKRRDSFLRIGGPIMKKLELYKGWPDCPF